MVHSDVPVSDNGSVADQGGDAGRRRRRYQVSDHSTVGKSNEFRYVGRRHDADFLRL